MEITKTDQMYALDILRSVIEMFDEEGMLEPGCFLVDIPGKLKIVERILEGRENAEDEDEIEEEE